MAGHNATLGLDIGRHTVKVAHVLRRGRRFLVARTEMLRLPERRAERERIVRRLLENAGLLSLPTVVGLGGHTCALDMMVVPSTDPRSVTQVVSMEVARLNDLAAATMIHDFVPIRSRADRRTVLLAMARQDTLDAALRLPLDLGLPVYDALPDSVAVSNALPLQSLGSTVCMWADVGYTGTAVGIGDSDGILFGRRFDIGGEALTSAVMDATGLGRQQAEEWLTHDCDLAEPLDARHAAAREAALSVLAQWLAELCATVALYRESFKDAGERPSVLYLCGGVAMLRGLPQFVTRSLDMRVEHPVRLRGGLTERAAQYAVAVGLALQGLGAGRSKLSLLPSALRKRRERRRVQRHWTAAAAVTAVTLGIMLLTTAREYARKNARLHDERRQLFRRVQQERELAAVTAKNRELTRMLTFARNSAGNGALIRGVVAALAEVKSEQDWITLIADESSYFDLPTALSGFPAVPGAVTTGAGRTARVAADEPGAFPELRSIVVEGYTPEADFSSVQSMIEKLRRKPFIEKVDLLSDDRVVVDAARQQRWRGTGCYPFAIEIKVRRI